jgi:hypothetical protein
VLQGGGSRLEQCQYSESDTTEGVTKVLQRCYKGVAMVLQRCYNGMTKVLQESYKSVTSMLQGCYKGVEVGESSVDVAEMTRLQM